MHERTFLAAMVALDLMLICAGGLLSWGYAAGGSMPASLIAIALLATIGAFALYHLNVFVFELAEEAQSERNSAIVAAAFVLAVLFGGLAGL